jgi:hypothetical protein
MNFEEESCLSRIVTERTFQALDEQNICLMSVASVRRA